MSQKGNYTNKLSKFNDMKDITNKKVKETIFAFFFFTILLLTFHFITINDNQNKIIDKLIEIENKL